MTTVPVTDMIPEYSVTTFSEDGYPSNKNYEITTGQLSILRTVNDKLLARTNSPIDRISPEIFIPGEDSPVTIIEHMPSPKTQFMDNINSINDTNEIILAEKQCQRRVNIKISGNPTNNEYMDNITSMQHTTPSLGLMFDKDKRIKLLEEEILELKNKQHKESSNNNLDNFTKLIFGKNVHRATEVNKRIAIVNYASMNKAELTLEDLEICTEDEIDKIYKIVKQYNDSYKKRIMVTHFVTIIIIIIEQLLVKIGFNEMKGISSELTSDIIDMNIGDDCEEIAVRIGIVNSPILNILMFLLKRLMSRIKL
ncbi:protein A11 [BeAn 58058 virus]|uniref:protein A11 n=1 Tax=BeAn 58058 virus TaxID=67082 RepID=UPI0009099953|nr:protein A11 [BeAn 58058 virus]APG58321.1 protein A11 [BeAn 58058 virus]